MYSEVLLSLFNLTELRGRALSEDYRRWRAWQIGRRQKYALECHLNNKKHLILRWLFIALAFWMLNNALAGSVRCQLGSHHPHQTSRHHHFPLLRADDNWRGRETAAMHGGKRCVLVSRSTLNFSPIPTFHWPLCTDWAACDVRYPLRKKKPVSFPVSRGEVLIITTQAYLDFFSHGPLIFFTFNLWRCLNKSVIRSVTTLVTQVLHISNKCFLLKIIDIPLLWSAPPKQFLFTYISTSERSAWTKGPNSICQGKKWSEQCLKFDKKQCWFVTVFITVKLIC